MVIGALVAVRLYMSILKSTSESLRSKRLVLRSVFTATTSSKVRLRSPVSRSRLKNSKLGLVVSSTRFCRGRAVRAARRLPVRSLADPSVMERKVSRVEVAISGVVLRKATSFLVSANISMVGSLVERDTEPLLSCRVTPVEGSLSEWRENPLKMIDGSSIGSENLTVMVCRLRSTERNSCAVGETTSSATVVAGMP